ncbi:nitrate- and nitrite sensing domain-containing protein [Spirillospora sp. NPDC052242]
MTLRDGLDLLEVGTLDANTGRPGNDLITALQEERRVTMAYLGRPSPQARETLDTQRARTDRISSTFRELADNEDTKDATSDIGWKRVRETIASLGELGAARQSIDRGTDRLQAAETFNTVIDATFRIFNTSAGVDDEVIAKDSRTLIALTRAREVLSREDALLTGALAAGRLTTAEAIEFNRLVGTQRFLFDEAVGELPAADRAEYEKFRNGTAYRQLHGLEERVIQQARTSSRPAVTAAEWQAAVEPIMTGHDKLVLDAGDRLLERTTPVVMGVVLRLALAGGLGLLAVIASVVVSITTARALVRQLEKLRGAAFELAEQRLPGVVERLGHGEKVDVATEAPPLQFGNDEIGQVGRAFNVVQETAIRTAVEQAELRRGIRDVLLSLARRTQTLVHRQLTMLDTMERRRDIETKELEELFRLDHLATRMRRNAENLIVLSGALPARGWRNPVPMVDVVRAAVGEVEDYTRVTVLPFGPIGLAGRAVGDVTHLLAELIENAVSFSPPDTVVQVGGHLVGNGFAIDIEDRGLGMTDEKLAEINQRIADPPDFNLQSSVQLGLFVVSKLAERYGLQVMLKRSAYGGTTAVVVIPSELIVEQPEDRLRAAAAAAKSGTTTPNGLEVRQPAGVGARAAAPAAGPALVAVPGGSGPANGDRGTEAPWTPRGDDGTDDGASVPPVRRDAPADEPRSQTDVPLADTGERPVTIEPEDLPPVPDISTTPSGLPVRVPQANLAEPLRTDEAGAAPQPDEDDDPGRSPEEIKRIMGSYQRGTRQGRNDAAATLGNTPEGEEEQ